jgi:hypothetical protein
MKRITSVLLTLFVLFSLSVTAQKKDQIKEIKRKAVKEARKEAKNFKNQGFYVSPGSLPMEKQLENSWARQYEVDEKGFPLYIVASGNSVANAQTAAKLQSTETAKLELAGTISTNVAAIIESSIANQQLSADDAASITKTVAASKNIIAQELGRVITLFEIYRKVGKDNIESNVRMAYNTEMAMEIGKKIIRKKLEEETTILHEKLDKLLNF